MTETESAPLVLHREAVRPEWVDYNGHMNVAYYVLVFDHASDAFFEHVGIGETYRQRENGSTFIVESHITYDQEVNEGDGLRCETQLLDFDEKRLHLFHAMYHEGDGFLAATTELMALHVDLDTRRVGPMPETARDKLAAILDAQKPLGHPAQAGRVIGIRRK